MSAANEAFEYFKGAILNPECDSLPLPDERAREGEGGEAILRREMPDGLARGLEAFARESGLDPDALLETAAMLLLAKYGGSPDALCALVRAGRRVPVYCDFGKETSFAACCRAVKAQVDEAARRSAADFGALCEALGLPAMPVLTGDAGFFGGFSLVKSAPETALYLLIDAKAGEVGVKYDAARYAGDTAGRLLDSLIVALGDIARGEDDAGAVGVLSGAQRAELDAFNETDAPYDEGETLVDRIARAAERFPENIAVVYKEKRYTYRELANLTDRIAAHLHRAGVGRGDVVSILIPRSEYMPICAVGVLKSGAAYQPLDPSYPPERLQFMMRDAGAKLLIADKSLLSLVPEYAGPVLTLDEIPALPACEEALPRPRPEDLFILLYTSGSTGTPKGVMLEHGNLAAFCSWFTAHYGMDEHSRAAAYASFGFDACMMDMYPALSSGAQLHIIPEDIRLDLIAINRYLTENRITHVFMTTQVGRQYAELFPDGEYPHHLSVGGETLVPLQPLNRFILERKPPYMVPAVTMQIERIPLNQNQKVDKRALPRPERRAEAFTPPETDAQKKICELLAGVVGHNSFGADTDFFEAGLTSVGSIKFLVLLTNAFGVAVTAKALREHGTAQKLEKYIASAEKAAAPDRRDRYPLTKTQMGIYVECMKHPEAVFYNLPGTFPLSRDTDVGKLCEAVRRVVNAHPAVKCAIRADEEGRVCMFPQDDRPVDVEIVRGTQAEYEAFFEGFARPFDFARGPLYRFAVFVTDEHVYLLLDFHHIVSDGSSIAVFAQELDRALRGEEPLGEAYSQFDLAADEERAREGEAYQSAKRYYDGVFSGVSGCTVPERDVYETQERCGFVRIYSDRLSPERVEAFCREKRITPNVFFLSVMSLALGRCEHADEVCLTTIYNGRSDGRTAATMGMLVKTLPVYAELSDGRAVAEMTGAMQEQLLSSMSNDIYSFAEVSRAYGIQSDVMFVYQGDDFVEFDLGGQKTTFTEAAPDVAKSALSIDLFVEKGRYRFEFEYRADMYSGAFISRLTRVLEEAALGFLEAKTLGDVNLTPQEDIARIERFNDTDYPVEPVSVNRLFERQAAAHPEKTALIAAGETLTYGELNRAANRVAHALIALGAGRDRMIGLLLERDKYAYIANLGVLKSGAAFLPMTPSYPDERIDYCLTDAGSPFIVTTEAIRAQRSALWAGKPYRALTIEELLQTPDEHDPGLPICADALAYCLYTSGSTGKPKGVMIEHRNLCNFVNANPRNVEITNYTEHASVSLALAALSFDVSVMEEFIPLCNGMTVCMATEDEIHDPLALARLMDANGVDFMTCTPSFLLSVLDVPQMRGPIAHVKAFDFGAEAFPPALYGRIREINREAFLANGYGPTECTVSCSTKFLNDTDPITIGVPLSNVKFYVVDKKSRPLPIGFKGELVICGAGVGRGYVNLPEKTREAFFEMNGLKAYHSGDLARWTESGEIDFLGRLDNQVKLRGLRVELDEIESAINAYEGVLMSKVVVRNNGSEDYLAGYFTAGGPVDLAGLTAHLRRTLTAYMVPGALMQLDKMPLTPNGKIDKKRLPDIANAAARREYVAPKSALEEEFCEQFARILGLERVGATDNFFEIGGTSLSATRIAMYALNKGYPIAYKDVFASPTPALLAALAETSRGGARAADGAAAYDYAAIDALLSGNTEAHLGGVRPGALGDILLTGATGFLGVHVLWEFLNHYEGRVYCLMRRGRHESCEERLKAMLVYYFSDPREDAFGERIVCIEGDVTDRETVAALGKLDFKTVVNCAALVKHFVSDGSLERINVGGVENLIAMCRASGKRLVQISTTSVAGEGDERTPFKEKLLRESELYFGQILDNAYVRSKFLAERAILESCARGELDGRIMRVGNLMSRRSDGEFQINFVTNGFMRTLKAYKALGMFPMSAMHAPAEFSPVDSTAAAILALASCEGSFTVFHTYNSHILYMSDVIYAMRAHGFAVEVVPDDAFDAALREASARDELSGTVLGLIAYDSGDGAARYEIAAANDFTAKALYRLGYKWPITDDAYLENAIRALETLGFFDNPRA